MGYPNLDFEKEFWEKELIVAGSDEVGRGAFAGPVVAGAVVFTPRTVFRNIVINDSKKLTAKQRTAADIWIRKKAKSYGIGEASVGEINRFGIMKATQTAFRRAIINCESSINHVLLDGMIVPRIRGFRKDEQTAIIKGDQKSLSIAAASIIAKVYRDNLMKQIADDHRFRPYFWDKNVGYGTKTHREAIKNYGATEHHRNLFVRNYR